LTAESVLDRRELMQVVGAVMVNLLIIIGVAITARTRGSSRRPASTAFMPQTGRRFTLAE